MTIARLNNDYKVGRGEIYFAAFNPGTTTPGGEAFFGDCNALSASIKATTLEHYQSTGGVKEVDASATIQSDSSGSLVTENMTPENLALFFFGSTQTVTTTVGTVASEVIGPVIPGLYYQLGMTANDPVGARGLDNTVPATVKSSDSTTTYVLGTDYDFDYDLGRVFIIPGGAINAGVSLKGGYKTKATTRPRVIGGNTPIEGAVRFLSANAEGTDKDWYVPRVRLTPNGSVDLIGDKYQMLTFDLKLLRKGNLPLLFIDGRAV